MCFLFDNGDFFVFLLECLSLENNMNVEIFWICWGIILIKYMFDWFVGVFIDLIYMEILLIRI